MTKLTLIIMPVILGTLLTVNGALIKTDDILAETRSVVNGANMHQLATVIELYYSDHNFYPNVSGGEALVDTLEQGNYIQSRPLDPSIFNYEPQKNGQDYSLKLEQKIPQ